MGLSSPGTTNQYIEDSTYVYIPLDVAVVKFYLEYQCSTYPCHSILPQSLHRP